MLMAHLNMNKTIFHPMPSGEYSIFKPISGYDSNDGRRHNRLTAVCMEDARMIPHDRVCLEVVRFYSKLKFVFFLLAKDEFLCVIW